MRKSIYVFFVVLSIFSAAFLLYLDRDARENDQLFSTPERPKLFHEARPFGLDFYENAFSFAEFASTSKESRMVAAVAPHHLLAADLMADLYANLSGVDADMVVLVGPNHFSLDGPLITSSRYDWSTPYGTLPYEENLFKHLESKLDYFKIDEQILAKEHSMNSHVAFIKKMFPDASFLPLVLSPRINVDQAEELVGHLSDYSKGKKMLLIASVDFSHYKSSEEAIKEDMKSISAIENKDYASLYSLDIDSPASIHVMMRFADLKGGTWKMLNNSNSAILSGHPEIASTTSYVTGYFEILQGY